MGILASYRLIVAISKLAAFNYCLFNFHIIDSLVLYLHTLVIFFLTKIVLSYSKQFSCVSLCVDFDDLILRKPSLILEVENFHPCY